MIPLPEKALSIRQPWAWAIVNVGKDIENRDWPTRYRGAVCIHASKGMTIDEWDTGFSTFRHVAHSHPFPAGTIMPAPKDLERGGIVGVAEIVDCVTESASPWFFGRYGFVLRNVRAVPFIPVKGALGFFDWKPRRTA